MEQNNTVVNETTAAAITTAAPAVAQPAVKKVEAMREYAFTQFCALLPTLRAGQAQKDFRRAVNTAIEVQFSVNHNAACSAYNAAKKRAEAEGLVNVGVLELGRAPEKNNGGRKAKESTEAVVLVAPAAVVLGIDEGIDNAFAQAAIAPTATEAAVEVAVEQVAVEQVAEAQQEAIALYSVRSVKKQQVIATDLSADAAAAMVAEQASKNFAPKWEVVAQ